MLLKKAQRHADAGPFLAPVSVDDVPDYYSIIIVSCCFVVDGGFRQPRLRGVGACRQRAWLVYCLIPSLDPLQEPVDLRSMDPALHRILPACLFKSIICPIGFSLQDPMDLGTMEQRLKSRRCEARGRCGVWPSSTAVV